MELFTIYRAVKMPCSRRTCWPVKRRFFLRSFGARLVLFLAGVPYFMLQYG